MSYDVILPGTLNEKIEIRKKVYQLNEYNQKKETWLHLKYACAAVKYGSGSNNWDSDANIDVNSYTTTFTFRYLKDFDYDCEIVFDGDTYDIIGIDKIRRRKGYNVLARRRENHR